MKKVLALVLILGLASQAGAAIVENWDGPEWSPGTSGGYAQNPNGDTIPPTPNNGWTVYTTWTNGVIAINSGVGYLGTVGAEAMQTSTDFRYSGAWPNKALPTPHTSGTITHYALVKISADADAGAVATSMHSQNTNTQVVVYFSPTWGINLKAATLGLGETNVSDSTDVSPLGWIAAEITLSGLGTGSRTVSARYRDVNDAAWGYIGDWIDIGSISDANVPGSVWYQGFYIGDWGNVWNPYPFGWVDNNQRSSP
jgi:hypothetical protein